MDRDSLQQMTVAELREEAKKIPDAKGLSSMKKDELVDLIASRAGAAPSTAAKTPPSGKKGGGSDKSDIKQRIQALKQDKRAALSAGDRSRARECNRQIHRYKRMLRKMTGPKK